MAIKYEFPTELVHRYQIRRPTGRRKSWRIIRKDGDKFTTVKSKALDAVNSAYNQGIMSGEQAERETHKIIRSIYKADGAIITKVVSNDVNRDILARFWEKVYSRRDLIDRESMYSDYRRAVDALGETSLITAELDDVDSALSKLSNKKRRRATSRINSLLKFLNRDFTIPLPRPKRERPVFLSESQFEKLENHLEGVERLMARMAFDTGCRIGELFALHDLSIQGAFIHVEAQLRATGKTDDTKTGQSRDTFVFPEGRKLFRRWVETKGDVTPTQRHKASNRLKAACRRAGIPEVRFHDLRHSYAVRLLQTGASMRWTAGCLGNSVAVCEDYYAGKGLKSNELQAMANFLDSRIAD